MFVSTRTAEAADDIQAILDRFIQHVYSVHRFVMYCVNSDMFVSPVYKTRPDPTYYYYYFLTRVLNSQGMKKLRYAIQ